MRTFALFCAKKLWIFQNLCCVDTKGGEPPHGHSADKGRGSIFRNFVRTSFMDGPNFKLDYDYQG